MAAAGTNRPGARPHVPGRRLTVPGRRLTVASARAAAGVVGPAAFTVAWIIASLRQTGYGWASIQISGLAAPDARDPWIMITGFLVLGGCLLILGPELGGVTSWLIQGAGVLAIAAALLRRDHMELTAGPVSWHNDAHNVVSLILYADMVLSQFLLAGRLRSRSLMVSAVATVAVLAVFLPNTTSPGAGLLQRIAVTIPLLAVSAVAVGRTRWRARSHRRGWESTRDRTRR